jgi:hypothetical protein
VKGHWQQVLTLRNTGGAALAGPLTLVFDHLGKTARLRRSAGTTRAPLRSPYLHVAPGADEVFSAGEVVSVTVEFTGSRPRYTLRALTGLGTG